MVQTPNKTLTLTEFLQLPETKPASEFIEGKIIQKSMPKAKHSRIQIKLGATLENFLSNKRIALPFSELRCTFAGRSLVPDLAVLLWHHIPLDEKGELLNNITMAPDWTIEILSPEQSQMKVTKNILFCLKNGGQMGWLIAPEEREILVYYPHKETDYFEQEDDLLPVPEFLGNFKLTLGELFGWLII
jgi:Uma2 family endonuclease